MRRFQVLTFYIICADVISFLGKKNMGDNDLEHPTHFSLRHLFFLLEGKKFSFVLRS